MDVDSEAVRLCMRGTEAEFQRRLDDARRLYAEAWEVAADDYEACVAAHYVAHLAEDSAEALSWNLEALSRAEAVGDGRADEMMGSLYVNLGASYELLGDEEQAKRFYALAEEHGVAHRSA